jgi:hypothetical protein
LENYYKNGYGTIEPDEIKAVKEKKRKLASALKVLNAHQYIMSNLSTNNCYSVIA